MPPSQSASKKNKLTKIIDQWPAALVGFGVALTIAWVAVLIGLLLYLLA